MGLTLLEALHLPGLTKEELARRIEIEGIENLHKAVAKNKGVLILTAHFGNWEIMSVAMGMMGYTGNAVNASP